MIVFVMQSVPQNHTTMKQTQGQTVQWHHWNIGKWTWAAGSIWEFSYLLNIKNEIHKQLIE